VATPTAVGIDDDFAAGEAGVALRATDDEFTGGVDEELGVLGKKLGGEDLLDDVLNEERLDGLVRDVGGVLRGDDDVDDLGGDAVHVADGDLGLRIGAKPFYFAALADLGELSAEAVSKDDRSGHEFLGLVGGEAEHQTLVAGALLGGLFTIGLFGVDALSDVGGLGGEVVIDENGVGVEDVVVVGVTNVADGVADDLFDVESLVDGLGLTGLFVLELRDGDFTTDHDDVGLNERFAGDAAGLIISQASIEDAVGDEIGDFVWVTFANGLGGENKCISHRDRGSEQRHSLWLRQAEYQHILIS
jgi:hypothetical protein